MTTLQDKTENEKIIEAVEAPWEFAPIAVNKEGKEKIVGFFPVYAPVDLIYSCNAIPLPIFGGGNQIEIVNADSRFASFICSISKSSLELGFQGKLRSIDGIIFSNICDVARNLSSLFKRNFKDLFVEYLHLPQNDYSESSLNYYTSELMRLQNKLAELTGCSPTNDKVLTSIRLYNKIRRKINELYDFKRTNPELVSTYELMAMSRYAYCVNPKDSPDILDDFHRMIQSKPKVKRDRIRVLLEGTFCEQPPLELIRAIEESGCWILDDDLGKGLRWFTEDVKEEGEGVRNLAAAYLQSSVYSSVKHSLALKREDALVKKVRQYKADGVIFCIPKFCEPALFDYVTFKERLEKENIPHLQVEYEEKMWVFDRIKSEVETFVESILFW